MDDLSLFPPEPPPSAPEGGDGNGITLADYAQTAYLEYALSVVKGRAAFQGLKDATGGATPPPGWWNRLSKNLTVRPERRSPDP